MKTKLKELVFNYLEDREEFSVYTFMKEELLGCYDLKNWPIIMVENIEGEGEGEEQSLGTHNLSVADIQDDFILIHCGSDCQKTHEIKLSFNTDGIHCDGLRELEEKEYVEMNEVEFLDSLYDNNARNIFSKLYEKLETRKESSIDNSYSNEVVIDENKLPFQEYIERERYTPSPEVVNLIDNNDFPFTNNIFFAYNPAKLGAIEFNRCVELYERRCPGSSAMDAQQMMVQLLRTEQPYKERLQNLAIDLVREMYDVPDSIDLKAMIETKTPEEGCAECQPEEEISDERKMELQPEIEKRRILNSIVHGCAVYQWTSAYHLVRNELNEMNPNFVESYNRLSACVNYWNWMYYFAPMMEAGQMPVLQGVNQVNIEKKEIQASGMNFPVLIHELSKGVMDYIISIGIPDLEENELKYVYREADKYSHEQWHYFFGPTLWKALLDSADVTSKELPKIVSKIAQMSYPELASFCKDIVFSSEENAESRMKTVKNTSF